MCPTSKVHIELYYIFYMGRPLPIFDLHSCDDVFLTFYIFYLLHRDLKVINI